MELNVARSRTCGEVLWCEVRFFLWVFSKVFLRHPFLHIREVSPFLSSLFSSPLSFLVCPPLLSSPLLFSFLPFPSLPFSFSSLPFSSLPFSFSIPPLFHLGTNTTTTTNTNTNIITPLTPNLQPIKPLSALLPSHPINPSKNLNPTSICLQKQKIYHSSRIPYIPRNIQVYTPTTSIFSIYITKKSIVLQPSQQTLLQQDCRATFSGSSGSSCVRKSQSIYMQSYLCFLLF